MFIKEKNCDFSNLVNSLKFKGSFEAASSLISGHLGAVQKLLQKFLLRENLISDRERNRLNQLPDAYLRLLTSPYLCELLMILEESQKLSCEDKRVLELQILQAVIAEIKREDPQYLHPLKPRWTLNGDFVLDEDIKVKFPALQTLCGIGINYQSYVHNTGKPGIGGYDFETAIKHKEKIEAGKRIIATVSMSSLSLVEQFTTVIQFRQNKNRPNVVNSSTHTSIGLIRCDNFQHLHDDMPEIVDMLVHESIHQYLHLFEEQLFAFVELKKMYEELLDSRQFPSPWSGNMLDIRSYTHAILVWYGLAHFWKQFIDSGYSHPEVSQQQAKDKLSEALVGFVKAESVLDNLKEHRSLLDEHYQIFVEKIQKEIQDKFS